MFKLIIISLIMGCLCWGVPQHLQRIPQISVRFLLKKKVGIKIPEKHQRDGMEILRL